MSKNLRRVWVSAGNASLADMNRRPMEVGGAKNARLNVGGVENSTARNLWFSKSLESRQVAQIIHPIIQRGVATSSDDATFP